MLKAAVDAWPSSRPAVKLDDIMCMNTCKEDELSPKLQVDWDDQVYYPSEDPYLYPEGVPPEEEEEDSSE